MKKIHYIIIFLAIAAVISAGIYESRRFSTTIDAPANNNSSSATSTEEDPANATTTIATFEDCVAAGKEVIGEKPNRRCIVGDDLAYIEIETCASLDGKTMNIFEARYIFDTGKCAWEGSAQDPHFCDETAGKWEIGILAYRKDCAAVCVIDIANKESRVDWRCGIVDE